MANSGARSVCRVGWERVRPRRGGIAMRRVRLFGLVVAVALVLTACGGWPMFGYGPAHLSSSPDTTLSTSNVATLTTKWIATVGDSVHGAPAVENGVAYF